MKRVLVLVIILLGLAIPASAQKLDMLLGKLDQVIQDKDTYNRKKEDRIDAIRSSLAGISPNDRYGVYDALYQEYAKYNLDSALFYAREKARLAEGKDADAWDISCIELADIYTNAGQYQQAEEVLGHVSSHTATYYHALHTLYSAMEATSVIQERTKAYASLKEQYRDSLIRSLPANDVGYVFALWEKLNEEGRYYDAILLLTNHYNDPITNENEKAILDYCMATSYKGLGNREKAEWHYAASAIADICTPVKEYRSLQELSYMLYQDGDLSRAYRYISCAMEDVKASNTIVRSMEFEPFLSTIGMAYEKDIEQRNKVQSRLMLGLSLLLILLALAVIMAMRQRHTISKANRALVEVNGELREISRKLQETGYLKEEYLYQYMEQAAAGIDKMESYRRKILLAYRKFGAEQLASQLESPLDVEDELRSFYNSFDETFIHLFPTFVEDVNRLLKPQQQLVPKPGRLMNTELRILALIRLGVTDNVKMAHFLRTSLSTVYNYRSKLRNAALSDQPGFEEQVAKIGEINIDRHE
ncbi:MAG: hypothetical protein J5533_09545 [Bacteroidales bacterium]|nr:hypothetical protein [Bacteroidales bacterium]